MRAGVERSDHLRPGEARVTVTIDAARALHHGMGADPVLDAAERAGLELPFRADRACARPAARSVDGAVTMAITLRSKNGARGGYILCCQARPTTPQLDLSYDDK